MAPKTVIASSFHVPLTEETHAQIKIGGSVRIGKDHGSRTDPINPPRIGKTMQVVGLGQLDEDAALALVGEILAGVTLLRRLHDPKSSPHVVEIRKDGEHGPIIIERNDFV